MNPLPPEQQTLADAAMTFVKDNSPQLVDKFFKDCTPATTPVSLFMAGSPGAGKTEVSKSLMKRFDSVPVRIDADEVRALCPGYTGDNAHVFQQAANKGVNLLQDHALKHGTHLILDGTFAYGNWRENVDRSLKRNRVVEVWYIHQEPLLAWDFTKAREVVESRHVDKEAFIRALVLSRKNIREAKEAYGSRITLNLLIQGQGNARGVAQLNVQAHEIDSYLGPAYTEIELASLIV